MRLALPPALVMALLLASLGTQVAYILAPRRPPYLAKLGLSLLALLGGEGLAALGVGATLALGDLHPLHDLLLLAATQWFAARWAARRV